MNKEEDVKIFAVIDEIIEVLKKAPANHGLSAIYYVLYQSHMLNERSKEELFEDLSKAWDYYSNQDKEQE